MNSSERSNQIKAIIDHLEAVRVRPAMFFGGRTEAFAGAYLAGFNQACSLLGFTDDQNLYWQVCEERGWELNSLGPQKHMRDAGWSDEAIVDEMLVIEIETWKALLVQDALPTSSEG